MATYDQRAEITKILDRARESLEQELQTVRQRYGEDVVEVIGASITFWHIYALKNRLEGIFHRIILRSLHQQRHQTNMDCNGRIIKPWKVVMTGNHGDVVIVFEDEHIHIRYYGEFEDFSQPWYIRLYQHARQIDRSLRIDYSFPMMPYIMELTSELFARAADRINNRHNPWV